MSMLRIFIPGFFSAALIVLRCNVVVEKFSKSQWQFSDDAAKILHFSELISYRMIAVEKNCAIGGAPLLLETMHAAAFGAVSKRINPTARSYRRFHHLPM